LPPSPSAVPISATPENASASPIPRYVVNRSLRKIVASTAMMIGETCSSIEAVPASTWCSPSLSATL
jgi:hypothetical protein